MVLIMLAFSAELINALNICTKSYKKDVSMKQIKHKYLNFKHVLDT